MTFVHSDILGSPVAETNSQGQIVSLSHYKAFGEGIEQKRDDIGYSGHKYDAGLGLSYMQARYYDPLIGRFYSDDPIGFRDVHSFKRYAYANNNPYKYTDPTGEAAVSYLNRPQGVSVSQHQSISSGQGAVLATLGTVAVIGCAATPCVAVAQGTAAIGLVNGLTETNVVSEALQGAGVETEVADGVAAGVDLLAGAEGQIDDIKDAAVSLFTGSTLLLILFSSCYKMNILSLTNVS